MTQTTLEIGDGTWISRDEARTRVRGGGAAGGRAWLARITGTSPEFGLSRDFLDADRSELSGSGASGALSWEIELPGLYEFRGFAVSTRDQRSGFVVLLRDGTIREVSRRDAQHLAAQLDAIRHRAGQLYEERVDRGTWDWDRTRRGARDALRAAVGDLAVGYPPWQFDTTVTSWAVYAELAAECREIAHAARLVAPSLISYPS